MKQRTIKQSEMARLSAEFVRFKQRAQAIIDKIAAQRDKFRDLISEYQDVLDSANDGIEDMETGLDRLSELL